MSDASLHISSKPDEAKVNIGFVIAISCIATLGGFLFGFDSGVINGTVDGLQSAFGTEQIATGFNVASMLLGCAIGAYFAGTLADKFGRRFIMVITAIFFIISAWGSGISNESLEFIIYRVLGGLAVGAASILAPAYIAEVAPAKYRGSLATIQQVAIISGLFVAFLSNYFINVAAGSSTSEFWLGYEAWRWMFWVEILPASVFLVALLFIPESPRFLVLNRQKNAATKVLSRIYGCTVLGKKKSEEIDASLASDHHKPTLSDLIDPDTRKIRRIVWVGIGLAVLQQFVGINVVFYYGAVLWQSVGFTEDDALFINVISGALSIGAVLLALLLVDRIGRKPLLKIGSAGMAFSLLIVAIAFFNASIQADGKLILNDFWGAIALIAANIYVVFFNVSWGPVMWVMLGEMFPNQIRGSSLAISGLAQWGANFLITISFPFLLVTIGLSGAYAIYTICAVLSFFFVSRMVEETKGKKLEQMQG